MSKRIKVMGKLNHRDRTGRVSSQRIKRQGKTERVWDWLSNQPVFRKSLGTHRSQKSRKICRELSRSKKIRKNTES